MKRPLAIVPLLISLTASASASPAFDGLATFTDPQAGYAIDYPAQSALSSGLDAALGYNTVFINFPSEAEGEFSGMIITVFDNPARAPIDVFARERFGLNRDAPGLVRAEWIGGMPALLANRPSPLTGEDAAVALIEGDGVIIRIALFGGGGEGPIEPPAAHFDWFNQIVHSIRRVPRQEPPAQVTTVDPNAEPPPATTFQMPFAAPVVMLYGEQYGVAVSNTAYGVRNLGLEHRRTCFGVDWPRLLHTGVDWFRADEHASRQTPTDVLAVADGVVAWYDPSYNSYPGKVVIVRHRLADGRDLYSMYAHLGPDVSIVPDQIVLRGQRIGSLLDQGSNTHLHFELRYFLDGRNIYGAYTSCNSETLVAGRGYTYRIHPDNFPTPGTGYVDPIAFISTNSGSAPTVSSPAIVTASIVTSTLRVGSDDRSDDSLAPEAQRSGVSRPATDPTGALRRVATTTTLTFTDAFTPTTAVYLPLLSRNFPPQEPACVEGQQLLTNTGLEDGPSSAPWVQLSNGVSDLVQEDRPFTGAYSLWFGGRDTADEEALQSFVLPHSTEGITLTFQRYVTTTETDPIPYDIFEVVIENAAGVEVTPRLVTDNTAAQPDQWVPETIVLAGMQPLGGQRLKLSLKIATDASRPTSFFVDDLSATTHCAP